MNDFISMPKSFVTLPLPQMSITFEHSVLFIGSHVQCFIFEAVSHLYLLVITVLLLVLSVCLVLFLKCIW